MNLSALPKITDRSKKRVGRGYGSGKGGHTAGRGTKGQKARNSNALEFEGAARGAGFYKRLPLLRGKDKLKPNSKKPIGVNVKYLNLFKKGSTVSIDSLIKQSIVDESARISGVKILGEGELTLPLTVNLPATKGAVKKIEKAGGTVEIAESKIQKIKRSKDQ